MKDNLAKGQCSKRKKETKLSFRINILVSLSTASLSLSPSPSLFLYPLTIKITPLVLVQQVKSVVAEKKNGQVNEHTQQLQQQQQQQWQWYWLLQYNSGRVQRHNKNWYCDTKREREIHLRQDQQWQSNHNKSNKSQKQPRRERKSRCTGKSIEEQCKSLMKLQMKQ